MADAVLAGNPGTVSFNAQRVDLARDALNEVRALSILLRDVLARERDELTVEVLGRGVLARVQALADAATDSLDPNGQPTDDIAAMVTCHAAACGGAHRA
jgi:hypothetical protein